MQLHALHPQRIQGRTDSDTFFASVKSVQNYTCVQLFLAVSWRLLYVKCMRKESHSHGAFQDFIRDIGAPNLLVTDNGKTQIGKMWTATSRQYAIKQSQMAPYNQNQNGAERKIQDVKRRVM